MLAQCFKDEIYDAKAAVKSILLHRISESTEFCRYSDNSTTIYYLNFQADILKLLLINQHSIKQKYFPFSNWKKKQQVVTFQKPEPYFLGLFFFFFSFLTASEAANLSYMLS